LSKIDHRELETILDGCKQLQPEWQRRLYDLLFDPILITISQFQIMSTEGEDIMQETFIRIFQNLETYNSTKSEITTWACTIAKRITINYCNSKYKRNLNYYIEDLENHHIRSTSEIIDFDWEHIKRTLVDIPEKYRKVFELSIYQGMKHKAIGEQLGITESSSRVYLSRVIELIKKDFKSIAS